MARFVLALDQGTTSSRAILFDESGSPRRSAQHEFEQHFRHPGWVEHDAEEIFQTQLRAAREVMEAEGAGPDDIAAIGITNQRETTVVWDRESGEAIHPAIVWQSRQTAELCDELREAGYEEEIRSRTGLVVDAYFSGTKLRFILDAVPGARARAARRELAFGTIDTWLLFRLSEGRVHATEPSNASRTLLYNIRDRAWDPWLLEALDVPEEVLPEVRDSSGHFAETSLLGGSIPILGVAGDQQSALFGQGCFEAGLAKNTYGTGCFFLVNTGEEAPTSGSGLVTTVAWSIAGETRYAIEGSVFVAGAAVQWLRDGLGLVQHASETEAAALSVNDTEGVYLVPAFVGLGAPYWDERARGVLVGLTRGTRREHVIRATLESMAYQSRDVIDCARRDSGLALTKLRVDGGACENDFLMQFQADILGLPVERPRSLEVTAFGAAALAGLACGFWESPTALVQATSEGTRLFEPAMSEDQRNTLYEGWQRAVARARDWETT